MTTEQMTSIIDILEKEASQLRVEITKQNEYVRKLQDLISILEIKNIESQLKAK